MKSSPPAPSSVVELASADLVEIPRAKPPSMPPPLPSKRATPRRPMTLTLPTARRVAGDDVVRPLSDALRDLERTTDALSAARLCLDALQRVIPTRVSIVHAFDVERHDFIVVHARGESATSMILERASVDDPLLRVAMPKGEVFPWNDLRKAPVTRLARFSELTQVTTALACPVVAGTTWLGAIELVDAANGSPFRSRDILGARYVAHRYARFLVSHGVVVDVATIARFAARASASTAPARTSAPSAPSATTVTPPRPAHVSRMTRSQENGLFQR